MYYYKTYKCRMKKNILVIIIITLSFNSYSQVEKTQNIIGENHIISSNILNEDRKIQIYLPENYHALDKKCPVIYVFDSQKYFLNAVAYQQNLHFQDETPSFIVVGIKTINSERSKLYNSESTIFISYLEKELLPYIDKTYRTLSSERVFFGWQRAAAFGIEILASKPKLFKGYFIASPTFLSSERVFNVGKMLDNKTSLDNYLYFTLSDIEEWSLKSTNNLSNLLKKKANNKLNWKYELLDNENHYSTPIVTMNNGLKSFFKDYPPIRYYSFNQFKKDGGISGIKERFKNRGERYQISKKVHDNTIRYLFLLAVRENNFKAFIELDNEFPNFLITFNKDYIFERFGLFYVKHKAYNKAIEYYKKGLQKFPESTQLQARLAEVYKLQKNYKLD